MDSKKLIGAIVAAYVVLLGTNYLVHSVWLMADYQAIPDAWRPLDQMMHKMWVMFVGQFFFAAVFAYIYTRGVEAKPWAAQGFRYGVLMAFLTVIPYSLSEYVTYRIPHLLAVKWMAAGTIQLVILGLIVAAICQKPSDA